jgi:hypothetical protein
MLVLIYSTLFVKRTGSTPTKEIQSIQIIEGVECSLGFHLPTKHSLKSNYFCVQLSVLHWNLP